ncbi:MAG: hypothetical protein AAGC88_12020 [Bacteroidota bacterium]
MKKIDLNELKKEQPFKAPDGYFEELPGIIQNRAVHSGRKTQIWELPVIKWAAVPAMIIAIAVFAVLPNNDDVDPDQLLAEVSTDELVAYLESTEVSTTELLSMIDQPELLFEENDADLLGDDLSEEEMELLLDNYDVLL